VHGTLDMIVAHLHDRNNMIFAFCTDAYCSISVVYIIYSHLQSRAYVIMCNSFFFYHKTS